MRSGRAAMADGFWEPAGKPYRMVLTVFAVVLAVSLAGLLARSPSTRIQSDFYARWYAVHMLLSEGRSVYDPANAQEVAAQKYLETPDGETAFYYPAHLAIVLVPFAIFPYPIANLAWIIVLQLSFVMALWLPAASLKWPRGRAGMLLLVISSVIFIPALQNVIWGQFNTLAMLALSVCYVLLLKKRHFWAGVSLIGFTFKPQQALFTLLFVLLWSAVKQKRRWVAVGFLAAVGMSWAISELLEPHWIQAFLAQTQDYRLLPYPTQGVVDWLWNPGGSLSVVLVLCFAGVSIALVRFDAGDPHFQAGLVFSTGIWWLVVPVIGMMHVVMAPSLFIILADGLLRSRPRLFRPAIAVALALYLLGLAGFLYGLIAPGAYGTHIRLAELIYKAALPTAMVILVIPMLSSAAVTAPGSPEPVE